MATKKKTTGKKAVGIKNLKKAKKGISEEKLEGVVGGALSRELYVKPVKPVLRSTCTMTNDEVDDT